ncbi:diacylglycerol kinase [Streptomyces armeniacus]|uniref:Diacylglycerol kinase n=1 Tax=Streptomyces armeniacus TaxID=83291 RepID=A0A345XJK2_9ACTN|nr:diacylglycerol kinase [Streptomyces armeniacus]AXK31818.1 diacylglycerol kinase [Streptomyces armeniacus]
MSAPDLLVVIDPGARLTDGESVRIARDVLCAGAPGTKVCLPERPEDAARALARRGSRRPVVVGDDRALLRTVQLLHRDRDLAACALAMVPVGPPEGIALAGALGVPTTAVAASRAVLYGTEHPLDLLVDDSGGVVLGTLRVPPVPGPYEGARGSPAAQHGGGRAARARAYGPSGRRARGNGLPGPADDEGDGDAYGEGDPYGTADGDAAGAPYGGGDADGDPGGENRTGGTGTGTGRWVPPLRGCRSLVRTLTRPLPLLAALTGPGGRHGAGAQDWGPQRLRVEADGAVLADLDRPVTQVSLAPGSGGLAEVVVRRRPSGAPLRARAHTVTVSGPDFRYRADALVGGPVRARTWRALAGAWRLTLPGDPSA